MLNWNKIFGGVFLQVLLHTNLAKKKLIYAQSLSREWQHFSFFLVQSPGVNVVFLQSLNMCYQIYSIYLGQVFIYFDTDGVLLTRKI